ncbi:3'-5' exonuclease [uncultured Succinivibrio sp.]|uniref:3'-5' exonuclease n=1 Tax=uncultured Succinivibrio sp. TaxID=540749 RepID=UPI0025DD4F96|nr:3'-5' exonuclease [uncultured Succinivibrio sp.]
MLNTDLSDIIIIDTETTGLANSDEVLQLSIIDGNENIIWDRFYKPSNHTSWYYAQKVNHISPEMVANKPSIETDAEEIKEIFASHSLVLGYNTKFDLRLLENNIEGFKDLEIKFEDVHNLYRKCENLKKTPQLEKHDLTSVSATLGFKLAENDFMHNSLTDVKATLFIFKKIIEFLE